MLNFPACLVLFSLAVLCLLPISAMAEGDGGWTTTASPEHVFQSQEGVYNNQKHLVMTVIRPDSKGVEFYWGPASGSVNGTYQLKSMNGQSDMMATWQFKSVTQTTVTVESCTTNCLWQSGQVVTLNKFFGDMKGDPKIASRVPKTGQTGCWDEDGKTIDCKDTGQDGEYQFGVLPAVPPSYENPYTVYGWTGTRFTDNLDGTVTDNLTGLIWLKNANCFGHSSWTDAYKGCNQLSSGSCGLTDGSSAGDWRLPNINELKSLVDPTQSNPALPDGYQLYFTDVQSSFYWSSTTEEIYPYNAAWVLVFNVGYAFADGKAYDYLVWPVRSSK